MVCTSFHKFLVLHSWSFVKINYSKAYILCLKFWRPYYVPSNFFIATIFIHSLLTIPFVLARDLQRYMSKNWDLQFSLAYAWHGSRNLTIYNILYAGLLGRWDKRLVVQASDVPSIFFFIISYSLSALKTLYFHFCNFIKKMNCKGFCKESCNIL